MLELARRRTMIPSDLTLAEHQPLALAEFALEHFQITPGAREDLIQWALTDLALRALNGEPLGCDDRCHCGWRSSSRRGKRRQAFRRVERDDAVHVLATPGPQKGPS
jgi:hypothetical protein